MQRAETELATFADRFRGSPPLDPEVSGIAGTSSETTFSHAIASWLADRFPRLVSIDWNDLDPDRLAAALTPLIPFLEEETAVDANVPLLEWLRAARPGDKDGGLAWLLRGDPALFDALHPWIVWRFPNSEVTRTRMRRRPRRIFYQTGSLLTRRDVSLEKEIKGPSLPVRTLTRRQGEKALDMARAALAMRQREVYCFTWGDPSTIVSADCGRGVEILLIGIVPGKRLPLRAGFAPLIFRNGVPIGYADAFGICDRMEVSFNIFYAFRNAEAAYGFAKMLRLYHQLFGSTSFSIDPYQIGAGNDEAIEAGAFWFYRKLGFHCTDPAIEQMARREEARIAADPSHRSSAATLGRLARGSMIYDLPGSPQGEWDRFHVRNLRRKPVIMSKEIARAKRGRSERQYLRLTARDKTFRNLIRRPRAVPP